MDDEYGTRQLLSINKWVGAEDGVGDEVDDAIAYIPHIEHSHLIGSETKTEDGEKTTTTTQDRIKCAHSFKCMAEWSHY